MGSLNIAHGPDQNCEINRYKAYSGESYYIYSRENTRKKLQDMLDFFDQFLRGDVVRDSIPSE